MIFNWLPCQLIVFPPWKHFASHILEDDVNFFSGVLGYPHSLLHLGTPNFPKEKTSQLTSVEAAQPCWSHAIIFSGSVSVARQQQRDSKDSLCFQPRGRKRATWTQQKILEKKFFCNFKFAPQNWNSYCPKKQERKGTPRSLRVPKETWKNCTFLLGLSHLKILTQKVSLPSLAVPWITMHSNRKQVNYLQINSGFYCVLMCIARHRWQLSLRIRCLANDQVWRIWNGIVIQKTFKTVFMFDISFLPLKSLCHSKNHRKNLLLLQTMGSMIKKRRTSLSSEQCRTTCREAACSPRLTARRHHVRFQADTFMQYCSCKNDACALSPPKSPCAVKWRQLPWKWFSKVKSYRGKWRSQCHFVWTFAMHAARILLSLQNIASVPWIPKHSFLVVTASTATASALQCCRFFTFLWKVLL